MQETKTFTVTFKKEVIETEKKFPCGYKMQVRDIYAMVPDTVTGGTPPENERILDRLDEVFVDEIEYGEWI